MNDEERFWRKVDKTDGCWFWTGATHEDGYGCFHVNGKAYKAHRYSWFLKWNEHPAMFVLHKCDNRNCVNPEHLFLGTNLDNVRDMIQKGRNRDFSVNKMCGDKNSLYRLSTKDVREIKALFLQGYSRKRLAIIYSVHRRTISGIVDGTTWKNV
jgi:hypothetical protein